MEQSAKEGDVNGMFLGHAAAPVATMAAAEAIRQAPGLAGKAADTVPGRVVRTAGQTAIDAAKDIPVVRALTKLKANWDATAPKPLPDATGENIPYAGEPPPQAPITAAPKTPKWNDFDATGENKPFAGGMDEAPSMKGVTQAVQELGKQAPVPQIIARAQEIDRAMPRMYRVLPKEGPNLGEQRMPFASGDSAVQHFVGDLSNDSIQALAKQRGIAQPEIDRLLEEGKANAVKGSGEGGQITAEDIRNNVKTSGARDPLTKAILDTYTPEELADKAERGNTFFRGTDNARALGKGAAAKEQATINAMFPELQ